jgi:transposase InsO family protein
MREKTVTVVDEMKRDTGFTYRTLCEAGDVAYASLMRWRGRLRRGEPTVRKAGPKKVEPLDFAALQAEVDAMKHCRKRTHGTVALYRRHRRSISRRDLGNVVAAARLQANWLRRRAVKRLEWLKPCFVWSIDDKEERQTAHGTVFVNAVRDVCSRYELPPVVSGRILHGEEVAAHLEELFREYPAPLFLKRDNASNLNHHAVDEVLSKHLVMPLNSPPRYPQYNGGRERGLFELWEYMRDRLEDSYLQALGLEAAHMLNHRSRRCLGGRTACEVFCAGFDEIRGYGKRRRREVYDWIKDEALAIMERTEEDGRGAFAKAWRTACEIWLQVNGALTVSVEGEVLRGSSERTVS